MNKDNIHFDIGSLTGSQAEAVGNEVNEDLIFSEDAYSSLGKHVPDETITECLKIGRIPIGSASATTAGTLNAKYVIHMATCGFDGHSTEQSITEALRAGLARARELTIRSIALPEIGRETSDIPHKRLAELILSECLRQSERESTLETVYLRLKTKASLNVFRECLRQI